MEFDDAGFGIAKDAVDECAWHKTGKAIAIT
jgi:hypothetical protein